MKGAKTRSNGRAGFRLLQGNSGVVIKKVLAEPKEPAIFWLDGHFSGVITATIEKYSPAIEKLQSIASDNGLQHIILIDDARCFVGQHGYPTIDEMKDLTIKHFPGFHFSLDEDIIRMIPAQLS